MSWVLVKLTLQRKKSLLCCLCHCTHQNSLNPRQLRIAVSHLCSANSSLWVKKLDPDLEDDPLPSHTSIQWQNNVWHQLTWMLPVYSIIFHASPSQPPLLISQHGNWEVWLQFFLTYYIHSALFSGSISVHYLTVIAKHISCRGCNEFWLWKWHCKWSNSL